jgi:hypothetical protein
VLPILDGLDELPDTHRRQALAEINTATDGGNPFVVTCRADEYEELVRGSGSTLTTALVVELFPVTREQVVTYLQRPGQEARWAPVFAALRTDGPLIEVLSVPFMASLARFTFARPDTDPADLCALDNAPAIRTRLLAAFLPAAYSPRPHPDLGNTNKPSYTTAQATKWLSFLARRMTRVGTVDLAWWRLHEMLSGWRRIALRLFLPVAPVGVLTGTLVGNLVDRETGHPLPTAVFALLGLVAALAIPIRPRRPGWVDPAVDKKAQTLEKWVSTGAFLVLGTWFGIDLAGAFMRTPRDSSNVIHLLAAAFLGLPFIAGSVSLFLGWLVYRLRVRTGFTSALPNITDSLIADRRFVRNNDFAYIFLRG